MLPVENQLQVVKLFRPLLEKINLSGGPKESEQQQIELSEFDEFHACGLGDCVLIVRRGNFTSTPSGYYTFSHQSVNGQNIFFLNIFLNNVLFSSENLLLRIKRHRTLVHEFTHCIAAFLSVMEILKNPRLITQISQDLVVHTRLNKEDHFLLLLAQFGNNPIPIVNALEIFPDNHFRIGYESFRGDFSLVYKQLILDHIIFEKYFTSQLRASFNQHIKAGDVSEGLSILRQVSTELIAGEAISIDFINLRLREELLSYYYQKAFES